MDTQMTQLTPSQAARRYADENGFKIVAVGRRYQATHSSGVSFERGGYAALLNEMRAVIGCIENGNAHPVHGFAIDADTPVGVEMCAGGTLVLPEPSTDPALNATANNCFGTLEPITPDTVPMSREEMLAPVKEELARLKLSDFVPERPTIGELDKAALRDYCKADFDDFNAEPQERIWAAAKRIAKHARKASGKPPGRPWHVIFNGSTVMKYGYASRADALAVVRWGFNHSEPRIRNNWRTAAVTVEYRP